MELEMVELTEHNIYRVKNFAKHQNIKAKLEKKKEDNSIKVIDEEKEDNSIFCITEGEILLGEGDQIIAKWSFGGEKNKYSLIIFCPF